MGQGVEILGVACGDHSTACRDSGGHNGRVDVVFGSATGAGKQIPYRLRQRSGRIHDVDP